MNFQRIYTIFLRQFFLLRRSSHRILGIFYWSALELLVWGYLTIYLNRVGGDQINFITVLIGTVILWNFLNRVQQGIAISFLEDVWSRNFMNLFSSPLSIKEYMGGLILVSIFSSGVALVFMVVFSWFLFAYNLFQFGFLIVPFMLVLFVFGLALGLYTTGMILRFGPSSEILAWSIPALLPPFSGVFYPIAALPHWLQPLSYIIPATYIFEGMRAVVLHGIFDEKKLVIAVLLSLFYCLTAFLFLLRVYKQVLNKGKLTRFQTE